MSSIFVDFTIVFIKREFVFCYRFEFQRRITRNIMYKFEKRD